MTELGLHLVFGTGQVRRALANHLGRMGLSVRSGGHLTSSDRAPFVLDTKKFRTTFGAVGTPLAPAVAATVAWYRSQTTAP